MSGYFLLCHVRKHRYNRHSMRDNQDVSPTLFLCILCNASERLLHPCLNSLKTFRISGFIQTFYAVYPFPDMISSGLLKLFQVFIPKISGDILHHFGKFLTFIGSEADLSEPLLFSQGKFRLTQSLQNNTRCLPGPAQITGISIVKLDPPLFKPVGQLFCHLHSFISQRSVSPSLGALCFIQHSHGNRLHIEI